MDLISLLRRSFDILRDNWILLVPTLIVQVVVPIMVAIAAAIVVLPAIALYFSSGGMLPILPLLAFVGLVVTIVALLIASYALAGQGYVNLQATLGQKARMEDFLHGGRKYFGKVIRAILILAVLFGLPILVLLGAVFAVLVPYVWILPSRMPQTTVEWASVFAPFARTLPVSILTLASSVLLICLIELIIYIMTLPWLQAMIVDEVGALGSLARCFGFVRKNILSVLGYIGLRMLVGGIVGGFFAWPFMFMYYPVSRATGMQNTVVSLPWGGMWFLVFIANMLITTFFTLVLFVLYVDRTRGLPPVPPPAQPAPPFQPPAPPSTLPAVRYCIYCGSRIQEDAVYCYHCGRMQVPHP